MKEQLYDLHIEAGLVYVGTNFEGEPEYIGTDKQWMKYEELINNLK